MVEPEALTSESPAVRCQKRSRAQTSPRIRDDRGPVGLRVGEVQDRGQVPGDIEPRREFVAAVHDVRGAGEVGLVTDQVLVVFGRGDAVRREQCIQNPRAGGDEVVVAAVQPDGKRAAARFLLRRLERRRAQKHFSVEQVQHEAVVVAQAVEGRRQLFIREHARVERRLRVVVGMIVEDGKQLRGVEDAAQGACDRLELRPVDLPW